jgi:hypothetical protein
VVVEEEVVVMKGVEEMEDMNLLPVNLHQCPHLALELTIHILSANLRSPLKVWYL